MPEKFKRTLINHGRLLEPKNSAFTTEEILAANARHDREYGWSIQMPHIYSNFSRLIPSTNAEAEVLRLIA